MADEPWWHSAEGREPGPDGDALGSAAQEAGRLFAAMRDRMLADPTTMRAGFKIMEAMSKLGRSGRAAAPGDAPECAYCPFCQAISRARNLSPETVERLTGAAMEFADVVKQVVGSGGGGGDEGGVRHVPLDDDAASWEAEDWLAEQEATPQPGGVDTWFDDPGDAARPPDDGQQR